MISWFNAPNEGLSPGGQLTLKTLTATENKTYSEEGTAYTSVTVNVEGGGGGDFSTAKVTVILNTEYADFMGAHIGKYIGLLQEDTTFSSIACEQGENVITTVLYKGQASILFDTDGTPSITGNAFYAPDHDGIIVTGDCTITIS